MLALIGGGMVEGPTARYLLLRLHVDCLFPEPSLPEPESESVAPRRFFASNLRLFYRPARGTKTVLSKTVPSRNTLLA